MKRLLLSFCIFLSLISCPDSLKHDTAYASFLDRNIYKPVVSAKNLQEERQIKCLADTIYYESRGESYRGQIAVGFVAINRTKSEDFPDNICEVVRQKVYNKYQFSWVKNKKSLAKIDEEQYIESRKVAEELYSNHNKIKDPTNGALYFHANYVKVKGRSKIKKAVIGKHIFYNLRA